MARQRTTKRCSKCGKTRARSKFNLSKSGRDGLSGWCRPCRSAYNATRRVENAAYAVSWRAQREEKRRLAEFEPKF